MYIIDIRYCSWSDFIYTLSITFTLILFDVD